MTSAHDRDTEPNATFADRAFRVTAEAYLATAAGWEHAIQAGLSELLEFLASEPEQTAACVAISSYGGRASSAHRDALIARFAKLLRHGESVASSPPPPVVSEAIGGGVLELIRMHVEQRRIEALPEALPKATLIVLTPFVGAARAEAVAAGGVR